LGIHDTVDIEKLCPVKIVSHVFLALGLSHCGLLLKPPAVDARKSYCSSLGYFLRLSAEPEP
jgi:hypothetical protein